MRPGERGPQAALGATPRWRPGQGERQHGQRGRVRAFRRRPPGDRPRLHLPGAAPLGRAGRRRGGRPHGGGVRAGNGGDFRRRRGRPAVGERHPKGHAARQERLRPRGGDQAPEPGQAGVRGLRHGEHGPPADAGGLDRRREAVRALHHVRRARPPGGVHRRAAGPCRAGPRPRRAARGRPERGHMGAGELLQRAPAAPLRRAEHERTWRVHARRGAAGPRP
mmetsp:Transcript_13718/g.39014  ORF Transcript_13718/g.39014 Transcript_13718/m.39014 type:complete len:222 (-) Transcript_13718:428-1093(-)